MGKLMACLVAALVLIPSALTAQTTDSLFAAGNDAYLNKDYETALNAYAQLESQGLGSAPLFFNIGNCHFKSGRPGYAILYYLRARKLDPFDADIQTNLEFARQFMPTRLEGVVINPVSSFMSGLVGPFTLNTLAWISSLLFIVFILTWSLRIYLRQAALWNKIALITLFCLVVVFSGLTTYKYRTEFIARKGVIVADEARIYSGPGEDNDVEFVGGFGLEFELEKENGDYYLVIFENQRKGWILKEMAALI